MRLRAATTTTASGVPAAALVDPAALYCQGTGGTVIHRTAGGRRADLCRMSDGRTVSAAELRERSQATLPSYFGPTVTEPVSA